MYYYTLSCGLIFANFPYICTMSRLILASKSPRRQELLAAMGYIFDIIVRETDETFPNYYNPEEAVRFISANKAKVFQDLAQERVVLSADTIVVLDDKILGKPKDAAGAFTMLQSLSNRSHEVMTACTLYYKKQLETFVEITRVKFAALTEEEIQGYIASGKPMDKAGAYGIQDWIGQIAITQIEGSYTNVVGLPTATLYSILKEKYSFLEKSSPLS
jgi:septum formation protein